MCTATDSFPYAPPNMRARPSARPACNWPAPARRYIPVPWSPPPRLAHPLPLSPLAATCFDGLLDCKAELAALKQDDCATQLAAEQAAAEGWRAQYQEAGRNLTSCRGGPIDQLQAGGCVPVLAGCPLQGAAPGGQQQERGRRGHEPASGRAAEEAPRFSGECSPLRGLGCQPGCGRSRWRTAHPASVATCR